MTRELQVQATPERRRFEIRKDKQAERRDSSIRVITMPAPRVWDPVALWDADTDAILWHAPGGTPIAGLGAAITLQASGDERFTWLDSAIARELGQLEVDRGPVPRFFGGFSFAPGTASAEPWTPFGDATFVLPRWTYWSDRDGSWLRFIGPADQMEGELATIRRRLESSQPSEVPRRAARVSHQDPARYHEIHQAILRAIDEQEALKIVLARRADVELAQVLRPEAALEDLRRRFRGCARFAMRRAGTTFLGASPERLVQRYGKVVATEALAGSVPRGQASAMLSSDKERREHRIVVQAILEALGPFCSTLSYSPEPVVRELPNVLHMQTSIEGLLNDTTSVLELAQALHPTPAVGGVPREAATRFIVDREAAPRGWYSAPFGWVDGDGDGELIVALRSGVLRGSQAWAWAGGGIVAESQSDAEYEESALKLKPILGAIGASEPE